jgi:hypothetical protein
MKMNIIFADFLNVDGKYNTDCALRVLKDGTSGKFMRSGILAPASKCLPNGLISSSSWKLEKWDGMIWTGFIWLRVETSGELL